MAKKDDVTTYTKAELIKALRASVAREAKLQKQVTKLEKDYAALWERFADPEPDEDHGVVHVAQSPPAFPWDVK